MTRSRFFRPFALAVAAIAGVCSPAPRPVNQVASQAGQSSTAQRTTREQTDRAPATVASAAANQSLGIIDAPDFRSGLEWRPIWVGRPRSKHGRQFGPWGRV